MNRTLIFSSAALLAAAALAIERLAAPAVLGRRRSPRRRLRVGEALRARRAMRVTESLCRREN